MQLLGIGFLMSAKVKFPASATMYKTQAAGKGEPDLDFPAITDRPTYWRRSK